MSDELTEKIVFGVLKKHVNERYQDVKANPEKLEIDRWNLSNFFYVTRKELDDLGYDTTPLNDAATNPSLAIRLSLSNLESLICFFESVKVLDAHIKAPVT